MPLHFPNYIVPPINKVKAVERIITAPKLNIIEHNNPKTIEISRITDTILDAPSMSPNIALISQVNLYNKILISGGKI